MISISSLTHTSSVCISQEESSFNVCLLYRSTVAKTAGSSTWKMESCVTEGKTMFSRRLWGRRSGDGDIITTQVLSNYHLHHRLFIWVRVTVFWYRKNIGAWVQNILIESKWCDFFQSIRWLLFLKLDFFVNSKTILKRWFQTSLPFAAFLINLGKKLWPGFTDGASPNPG